MRGKCERRVRGGRVRAAAGTREAAERGEGNDARQAKGGLVGGRGGEARGERRSYVVGRVAAGAREARWGTRGGEARRERRKSYVAGGAFERVAAGGCEASVKEGWVGLRFDQRTYTSAQLMCESLP
jgi:hypothetical protein